MTYTIFGKSDCPRCLRAKVYCERKGWAYTYVDIEKECETPAGMAMMAYEEVLDCTLPVIKDDMGTRYDYDLFVLGVGE